MIRIKRLLAASLLVLATAVPVFAAIKLASAVPGNHTTGFTGSVFLPLNSSGATTLTFNSAGVNEVTFSAECAVSGNEIDWISLQIYVDGVIRPPTADVFDAFCGGDGTPDVDGWATHSISVGTQNLAAGAHTVRVEATVVNNSGGASGWIADSSLVVKK